LWQAAQQLHCFLEVLVIPRFTPADPLEFVNAKSFSTFKPCTLFFGVPVV
jgi:hypothetical protein